LAIDPIPPESMITPMAGLRKKRYDDPANQGESRRHHADFTVVFKKDKKVN